jgi:serine phosphatase RsbU (regulator of sigma subunit)
LLLHPGGGVSPVGRLGTALGLLEEPDLYDSEVSLAPGDLMCMFTDGLVETRNGVEMFGAERVAAVMSGRDDSHPERLADALVAAAREFHGGPHLEDDLAILLLRAGAATSGPSDAPAESRAGATGDGPLTGDQDHAVA